MFYTVQAPEESDFNCVRCLVSCHLQTCSVLVTGACYFRNDRGEKVDYGNCFSIAIWDHYLQIWAAARLHRTTSVFKDQSPESWGCTLNSAVEAQGQELHECSSSPVYFLNYSVNTKKRDLIKILSRKLCGNHVPLPYAYRVDYRTKWHRPAL